MENTQKKGYKEFAASIKAKYPVYNDMDDMELAKKVIDKYPVYADQVSFDEVDNNVKKKDGSADGGQSGSQSKSENIDDLTAQLGQPEEVVSETPPVENKLVNESFMQDGMNPPMGSQEPSDGTNINQPIPDLQTKPTQITDGPRVKTTQELENEGKNDRYLPANGALLDIERANRFVQEKQAEAGVQLTDEEYRGFLSEALRGQAMSQGLSDQEIIKAELDLANDHGINLDITGDGILKTGIGMRSSAWRNLQTGTMEAARGVNTFVIGGGIEALKKIGIELPRELEMFLKDEFVNNQNVNGLIDRLSAETRGYEQGLIKSLAEKNYSAAFGMMLDNTSRSLPISLMAGITQGAGVATSMSALAAMSAGMQYQEVKDEKWFREMGDAKKAGYLAIMGGAEAIGEYVGGRVLSRVVGDVVKDFGNEAAKKTLKEFAMGAFEAYGINTAEEYAGEMATSLIQNFVDAKAKGEDIEFEKYLFDAVEGGLMGMGGAAITTTVGQSASAIGLANKYRKDYSNQKLEKRKVKLEEQINAAAERGAGPEAVTIMVQELAKVNSAIAKRTGIDVEIISRMSGEERTEFTSALEEAKRLKESAEEITDDDDLKQTFIDKANEATAKAKELAGKAANKKPVDSEQPTPDEKVISKDDTNKEKSNTNITTPDYLSKLKETKESDPSTYWSVDSIDEKTAEEGTVVDVGDGYGLVGKDGDIKGVFKDTASKAKGVADRILKKAIELGGVKLDNFDGYLTKIYKRNGFRVVSRVPFSEEYAPDGWNKEKHGTPDVVAMVYDPEGKLQIEEKSFDDYNEAMAYRDTYVDDVKSNQQNEAVGNNTSVEQSRLDQQRAISAETEGMTDEEIERTAGDRIARRVAVEGTIVDVGDGYGFVGKDGNIKGVFKDTASKAKGVADRILKKAVELGGIKLDNFDGYLTKIYKRNGFRVVSRVPFNEEYAPDGWDKEKHGTPDVVAMVYDPEGKLQIEEKSFDDYDEAMAYRDTYVNQNEVKNGTEPKAGNRLFNESVQAVKEIANKYVERVFGSKRPEFKGVKELDKKRAKRISDAYDKMEDNPNDPEVKAAYDKLVEETIEQYKSFIEEGYFVEINNDEPYSSSQEMIDDLRNNKRMKIFSTESGFGANGITDEQRKNNPLLAPTEYTDSNGQPLLVNDIFRAIHDFFGHAELGNSFGPLGEENAWNVHARMFSPLARRAMTSETRGQNSYVNFSGINEEAFALRDKARELRKQGKNDEAAALVEKVYEIMKFADQKIGLLPEEFSNIEEGDGNQDASLEQEVSDLDALMNEDGPDVDFKTETTTDEETNAIVDEMNAEGGDISKFNIDKAENSIPNTGIQEASNRVGQVIPTVSMKDIDGAPVVFTISDQLTSSEVVNPATGNKISNLKGGLLYNYVTKGRAWANVSKAKAEELIRSAKLAYENNKVALEAWWEKNPQYKNHVPLVVVKMGNGSILSNEAIFRLLADNLSKFPETNKKKALLALKKSLESKGKQASKTGIDARSALELINKSGIESISDIFKDSFYGDISLGARASIIGSTAYGQPNTPGEPTKSTGLPGEGSVARAIIGLPSKGSIKAGDITAAQKRKVQLAKDMFHMGTLTDLITEPSIKDVPIRNVISINAIDISDNGGVVSGDHPNYPFAVKGKPIGVLGNSVPVKSAFPKMYAKVLQKAKLAIEAGRNFSEKSALSGGVPVQMGLAGKDFIGMLVNSNPNHADSLAAWMNLAFPNTNVSTSIEDFDRVMSNPSVSKKTRKGVTIYGVTINGDVYINPDVHNSQSEIFDTLIHEFGHVWSNTLEQENKALFNKGAELVKKTAEYAKWFKKYKNSGMSDAQASAKAVKEAMSVLIGNKGASITDAALKSKWGNFINAVWNYLSKRFKLSKDLSADDIQNMRLDEFIGTALADIMSGGPISEMNQVDGVEMKDGEVFFSSSDNMSEVIDKGRQNGFSDSSIKEYLRRQGFSVKEITQAMEDDFASKANAIENVPAEFGDVEGGMVEGAEVFKRAYKAIAAYAKKKVTTGVKPDPKTGKKIPRKRTHQEIRAKAQEIIMSELENVNASEMAKLRMMNAFDKAIGLKGGKSISKDLREIRKEIRLRGRGERSLSQAKVKMRVFIRKHLPLGDYNKSQVMELIKIVNDATSETIQDAQNRVAEAVVKQNAKRLLNRIDALKKLKLVKTESGRVKGVVDEATQAFLKDVFDLMPARNADYAVLEKVYDEMVNEYEALESKDDLTEEEGNRLAALITAMEYTSALMMSESDAQIIDNLTNVVDSISAFAATGRNEVKARAMERKAAYNSMKSKMFEDVSGVMIDYNNPDSVAEAKRAVEEAKNLKDNSGWLKKAVEALFSPIDMLITRVESIEGLIDRLSVSAGKMFEGVGQELITNRIRQASAQFKGGKNALMQTLNNKAKDIFGKKYKDILDRNKQQNTFFYTNPNKAAVLESDLAKAKTKQEKNRIQTELNKIKVRASQNELYYLYNQYKDESTHEGFRTKFGDNYADVMDNIVSQMDAGVKEWADWQVDVFFPSVYERYNDVYKRLYNTNMPMSMTYAGKLVREGDEGSIHTDLFDTNRPYVVNVASGSTKARQKNKKAVSTMDGDKMVSSYVDEMEFFRSHAETMRDINKIAKDPLIKKAIEVTSGKDAYKVFNTMINRVTERAKMKNDEDRFMDRMTNRFVKAKLGFNPTVYVKQLTSAVAFADYIGYRNWAANGIASMQDGVAGFNSDWKELYANSLVLQDRYENGDISRTLENYVTSTRTSVVPANKMNAFNDMMMYLIKQGDKGGVMGSIPNYRYYKQKFAEQYPNLSQQQIIEKAVAKVEAQITSTQQSSDVVDKDFFQTGGSLMRGLNVFLSSPKALFRKEIVSVRNLYRKMAGKESKGSVKDNLRTLVTYHMVVPMLFQYVALGFPGLFREWREDDEDELMWAGILGNINAVFLLSDIFTSIKDVVLGKPWASNVTNIPTLSLISDMARNFEGFSNSKSEETADKYLWKGLILASEIKTGVAVNNLAKFGDNIYKVANGETEDIGEDILRVLNYSDYTIVGMSGKLSEEMKTLRKEDPAMFKYIMEMKKEAEEQEKEAEKIKEEILKDFDLE